MSFSPNFSITPKINKSLVEIERVRGFLDAVKLKSEWFSDMQKEALILESHYSTHIEGTALSLEQAKSILEGRPVKGVNIDDKKEFIEWLNQAENLPPILIAGIAQFQFVHIHPFLDGNGRTARLLSTLILYKTTYDFKRMFTLSEYYDKDRPAYYNTIQSVRERNIDLTAWLEYFVEGLRFQMVKIKEKGERIVKREALLKKISKVSLNERQKKALKHIVHEGKISVRQYQKAERCIRRTAQRDLADLVKKGILKIVAQSPTDPSKYYELL